MNATMMTSLANCSKVMQSVNASMNPAQMNETMKQFAMETEKMGM